MGVSKSQIELKQLSKQASKQGFLKGAHALAVCLELLSRIITRRSVRAMATKVQKQQVICFPRMKMTKRQYHIRLAKSKAGGIPEPHGPNLHLFL